jgi:hypothetical protein
MTLQLENPYLEEWRAQLGRQRRREGTIQRLLERRQFKKLPTFRKYRKPYQDKYSYAIPNEEALSTLSEFAPLVEVGAGTGYWAWLLRQRGTDIICYDSSPPSPDSGQNQFHPRARCWSQVLEGDETVVDRHPERTLFLCWPPLRDSMAYRALARYRGNIFVGVFEAPQANGINGSTADDQFMNLLKQSWSLIRRVDLPHWELCWDALFVFQVNR